MKVDLSELREEMRAVARDERKAALIPAAEIKREPIVNVISPDIPSSNG